MQRKSFLILAMFASSAFATNYGGNTPVQSGNSTQTNMQAVGIDVSNRITNDTRAAATSFAAGGNAFAAGGTAVSGGGQGGVGQAVSGGSSSGVNFEITSPKNTPSVFSGNVYPTAPCMGSSTVGGAGVGFGVSLGTSWTNDECGIRETSRSFSGLGKAEDALKILCTSKYAAAAPSCAATKE